MEFSIALIVFNKVHLTVKCIESIFRHSKDFELIVCDNGCTDGTTEYLSSLQEKHDNIIVWRNEVNQWTIKPGNENIRKSSGNYVVTLGNSTKVCQSWLEILKQPFITKPNTALTGLSNQCCTLTPDGGGFKGERLDYINGNFLMIPRWFIENYSLLINGKLCLYDEELITNCYCEDSDLSLRATHIGYDLAVVDLPINYIPSQTFNTMKDELKKFVPLNQKALVDKWGLSQNPKYRENLTFMKDKGLWNYTYK